MAGDKPSISRRRILGAAAALPVLAFPQAVRAEAGEAPAAASGRLWAVRLARYRRLAAVKRDAAETGWFRAANDAYAREREAIAAAHPDASEADALQAASWDRMAAAEDAYWERCTAPAQRAAIDLVLTPAPDVAALRDKLAVMREIELLELDELEPDWLAVLEKDAGRL